MEKPKKFEDKLNELERIIHDFETGEIDLDDAINKYTEAMKLVKDCSDTLTNAEKKVTKILTESGKLEEFKVE